MTRNPYHAALNWTLAAIVAIAILVLLTLPADAAPSAYTCIQTTEMWRKPPRMKMVCTNGFSQSHILPNPQGPWVPVKGK